MYGASNIINRKGSCSHGHVLTLTKHVDLQRQLLLVKASLSCRTEDRRNDSSSSNNVMHRSWEIAKTKKCTVKLRFLTVTDRDAFFRMYHLCLHSIMATGLQRRISHKHCFETNGTILKQMGRFWNKWDGFETNGTVFKTHTKRRWRGGEKNNVWKKQPLGRAKVLAVGVFIVLLSSPVFF